MKQVIWNISKIKFRFIRYLNIEQIIECFSKETLASFKWQLA